MEDEGTCLSDFSVTIYYSSKHSGLLHSNSRCFLMTAFAWGVSLGNMEASLYTLCTSWRFILTFISVTSQKSFTKGNAWQGPIRISFHATERSLFAMFILWDSLSVVRTRCAGIWEALDPGPGGRSLLPLGLWCVSQVYRLTKSTPGLRWSTASSLV